MPLWCTLFIICLISITFSVSDGVPMKVIIDTDAGTDDAVAIFLALACPQEVEVVAITTTYGNTAEKNVETNVLKILTVANRSDIPVYSGATKPFVNDVPVTYITNLMGKDGLGDVEFNQPLITTIDRSKTAAEAMVDLVKRHPGEINVLTLGPLTNVATAQLLDSSFTKNVKRFYCMGTKLNFPHQHKCNIDFNFGHDPEAIKLLFSSPLNTPALILSSAIIQANNRIKITKEWRMEVLGRLNSDMMRFLNKVEAGILDKLNFWSDSDSLTTALMIWPKLVVETFEAHIDVITQGETRGAVVLDPNGQETGGVINVEMVRDFSREGFQAVLIERLGTFLWR